MQIGAVYLRVSTDEQTEYSPSAQLHAIKEYARKNDIVIANDYIYRDEGISGRRAEKRQAFQEMIATAKAKPSPFDVILVHKFDRFARNREDSIVYKSLLRKECGIRVISITEPLEDDKMSVLIEALLEAMAEYYSLNLAEEVRKGLFEKARRGENIGKAPYGYKLENGNLVPHETESEIVKYIFSMYETESVTKIVQHLNITGVKTKTNGRWTQHTLIYILGNPVYYGVIRYNYRKGGLRNQQNDESEWILAPSKHEPLISKDIYDRTQQKLKQSANQFGRNFSEKVIRSWVQHLVRCEICGSILTISSSDNQRYRMFRCSRVALGTCTITNTFSVTKLEKLVLNQIKEDFKNIENITIEKIISIDNNEVVNSFNKRLQKIEHKKHLIRQAYLAEADTLEEYKRNKLELDKEENEIRIALNNALKASDVGRLDPLQLDSFIQLIESPDLNTEEKNKVAKQFIKQVNVDLKSKDVSIIYYF